MRTLGGRIVRGKRHCDCATILAIDGGRDWKRVCHVAPSRVTSGLVVVNCSVSAVHVTIEFFRRWLDTDSACGPQRMACVEYLHFNDDGTIQEVKRTESGVGSKP